ncbi:MAG: TonB-dependent receptor, partial [Bacteroidota bacterium]
MRPSTRWYWLTGLVRAWIAAGLAVVGSSEAVAQTTGRVEGRVIEAESDLPVPGANVVLDGTTAGAATDTDGRFVLEDVAIGTVVLVATAVGFEPLRLPVVVEADATTRVTLRLLADVAALAGVVVTGEKERRSLLDTYTSVGVLPAADLDAFGVNDVREAVELLGNVTLVEADNRKSISLRGLNSDGLTQPINDARTVSFVVDGVTQTGVATTRGLRGLWDVAQVEVLRGPQSTVYGRNSVAGAVVVETRAPSYDWTARAQALFQGASVQGGAGREFAVAGGGPIVPGQVAFRVSAQVADEEFGIGYPEPLPDVPFDNDALDDSEYRSLRAKLLIEPKALDGLSVTLSAGQRFDQPGSAQVTGPDFFERFADLPPGLEFRETTLGSYGARAVYEATPSWRIEALSARATGDTDIFTPPGSNFVRDELRAQDSFTQELRVAYQPDERPGLAGRLSGTAGLFYGWFGDDRDSEVLLGESVFQDIESDGFTEERAVFADARLRLGRGWTLLAGARVLAARVEDTIVTFPGDATRGDTTAVATDFTALLPEGGLAFAVTPTQRLAFTVARGVRAGDPDNEPRARDVFEVDTQAHWNADLAYRSQWFDGWLALNATVFHYRYYDQQIAVEDTTLGGAPLTITRNAGRSSAWGVEVEPRLVLGRDVTVYGSAGWLRTRLDDFVTAEGDFSGNTFPGAPSFTAALGASYVPAVGVTAAVTVAHTGAYYSSPG